MDQILENSLKGNEYRKLLDLQFSEIRNKYNLKKVDIDVLYFLSKRTQYDTPTDIHHQLKINRGHVSQAIDTLFRKQYIIAIPDQEDRRYIHYMTTEKASAAIAEIDAARKNLEAALLDGIPPEDLETYKRVSTKIRLNIEQML